MTAAGKLNYKGLDMLTPSLPPSKHAMAAMAIMIIIVLQQCRPTTVVASGAITRTLTTAFLPSFVRSIDKGVNARNEPNDCARTGFGPAERRVEQKMACALERGCLSGLFHTIHRYVRKILY